MKSVGQVIGPRFVPVRDEPVADLMTEKGEIAAARLTMSWKDALSDPGPDDLFVVCHKSSHGPAGFTESSGRGSDG
jgi:hypothetical protein